MAIDKAAYSKTKYPGIKIHKDGVRFWFDFKLNGKRYSRLYKSKSDHTKSDRIKEAYKELEKIKEEIKRTANLSVDEDSTVGDYWLKIQKLKGWKPERLSKFVYYYNKHLVHLDKLKIKNVKPAHFTDLNIKLSHLALSTQQKAYEILKPIFDLAVEDDLIIKSPIKDSHIPRRKQIEEKKIVTNALEKYKKVHKTLYQLFGSEGKVKIGEKTIKCEVNPHHLALFLFGFHGRRRTETTSLQWEDIDFDNNTYIIRAETSKVNTDMIFTLPQEIKELLEQFRDTTGNVFHVKKVYKHYPKIRLLTGIEEFSFHWMRNLAVSALSSQGASLTDLTAMLGHQDNATLKKYLSLQRDENTKRTDAIAQQILNTSDKDE